MNRSTCIECGRSAAFSFGDTKGLLWIKTFTNWRTFFKNTTHLTSWLFQNVPHVHLILFPMQFCSFYILKIRSLSVSFLLHCWHGGKEIKKDRSARYIGYQEAWIGDKPGGGFMYVTWSVVTCERIRWEHLKISYALECDSDKNLKRWLCTCDAL